MIVVRPTGRGVAVIAVFATSAIIVTIVNSLRVYVRLRVIRGQRTIHEDLAAGLGWLLFLFISSIAIAETCFGSGRHVEHIPPENLEEILKMAWVYDMTYIFAQVTIKHSISLMLLRYAVEDYHKMAIKIVTFAVHAMSAILLVLVFFQCIPISFWWTRAAGDTKGICLNPQISTNVSYVWSAIIILYDVTMALLPWLMVRKLKLDVQTRVMVAVVLAMGSIAGLVTIIRIPFIVAVSRTMDFSYIQTVVNMISCCEIALGFCASSAATLRPLFRRGSTGSNRSNKSGNTPVLNTIPSTPAGSSTSSYVKESEIEFSTAFYGGAK